MPTERFPASAIWWLRVHSLSRLSFGSEMRSGKWRSGAGRIQYEIVTAGPLLWAASLRPWEQCQTDRSDLAAPRGRGPAGEACPLRVLSPLVVCAQHAGDVVDVDRKNHLKVRANRRDVEDCANPDVGAGGNPVSRVGIERMKQIRSRCRDDGADFAHADPDRERVVGYGCRIVDDQ